MLAAVFSTYTVSYISKDHDEFKLFTNKYKSNLQKPLPISKENGHPQTPKSFTMKSLQHHIKTATAPTQITSRHLTVESNVARSVANCFTLLFFGGPAQLTFF